jgi:hypothetical protein
VNLTLPFDQDVATDLDALLEELDAALDASFLGEMRDALERAAAPAADVPTPAGA